MYGLTVEEASGPPVEIWPDNMMAVGVFVAVSTQWRMGFNGPTGLDYSGVESAMRMAGVPRREWADTFESIRIMEDAALRKMREKGK